MKKKLDIDSDWSNWQVSTPRGDVVMELLWSIQLKKDSVHLDCCAFALVKSPEKLLEGENDTIAQLSHQK